MKDVEDNYMTLVLMETASDEFDIEWLKSDDGFVTLYIRFYWAT